MKDKFLILSVLLITITVLFVANLFMNLYHYGYYLKIEDSYIFYCESDYHSIFCDNASVRIMERLGLI